MYLRKSRKDEDLGLQGESLEATLARHEAILRDLADKMRLNVDKIYREVESGDSIAARPVMQHLLKEVEQGIWKGVLVVEVERLARGDTADQGRIAQAFKYSETLIITPNKTYDPTNEFDEEYFEFGLYMSRRELKTITRRLQTGRERAVREGKFPGNVTPYGYERVKLQGQKGYTLKELSDEAKVVQMVFDWYTVGVPQSDGTYKRLGTALIARRLNQLKIPSKKGGLWTVSTIKDMLKNPTYTGKVRWNRRPANKRMVDGKIIIERPRSEECIIVDGLHNGLVSQEIYAKAQDYMRENPPRPVGERNTVKNPLSGLVICGMCGRRMVRRPYGKNGYPDTLMCAIPECPNVSSSLKTVENKVLEGLKDWLADYKLKWQIEDKPNKSKNPALDIARKALIKLDKEIDTLNAQMSNLDDLLEQGLYTPDKYKQRTKILDERIKQAVNDRKDLLDTIAIEGQREEARKNIIPKVEYLLDTYHALPTPQAKNDLLKEVLEKIVYTKTKSGRWHSSPDNFELMLYPKLPRSYP